MGEASQLKTTGDAVHSQRIYILCSVCTSPNLMYVCADSERRQVVQHQHSITHHRSVFSAFSPTSSQFRVMRHLFFKRVIKKIYNARTRSQPAPTPLAVKFTSSRPVVILHPFWRSNSPLPPQRSSSNPSSGQIHPSPPSSHPPALLAVKFTPPYSAVILRPCLRSNSLLSAQRSSCTPAGGQLHPSAPGGQLPPLLLAAIFIPAIGTLRGEG